MQHPCNLDSSLEGCAELAEKHAGALETTTETTLSTLKAHAPKVVESMNAAVARVGEWVEAGEAFAVEQAPLLVKEVIYWEVTQGGFYIGIGLLLLAVSFFAYRKAAEYWEDWEQHRNNDAQIMSVVGVICGGALGLAIVAVNTLALLKPLVAPRLFLIEFFRRLIQ